LNGTILKTTNSHFMKIKINMLNVGDADAIIVQLEKKQKQLVILIDGGNAQNAESVINKLESILLELKKDGPDLVICTHYDADHIGGLKKIARYFGKRIGMVWIHKPNLEDLDSTIATLKESQNHQDFKILEEQFQLSGKNVNDYLSPLLESYKDMEDLVRFLEKNSIETFEPFAGDQYLDWDEIKVLGPTPAFYQTLLPKLKSARRRSKEQQLYESNNGDFNFLTFDDWRTPCDYLDKRPKVSNTAVNQASIIIQIKAEEKNYLFTGDAAIQSFKNISGYPQSIENIYWLKVAHHGSRNNNSSELFELMKPAYAFVSGDKHIDDEVVECLKRKGVVVKTTKENGDLSFPYTN